MSRIPVAGVGSDTDGDRSDPDAPQSACGSRPVMARRRSESMLILHTAMEAALRSMSSGHAHGAGHLAAVLVDHLHILGHDGGSAVQHDGEAGQTTGRPLPECQSAAGASAGLNLYAPWLVPMAMARESHAGAARRIPQPRRDRCSWRPRRRPSRRPPRRPAAQLAFHHHAVVMGIFHHLLGHARCSPQRAGGCRRS